MTVAKTPPTSVHEADGPGANTPTSDFVSLRAEFVPIDETSADLLKMLGPSSALLFDGLNEDGASRWRAVHRSAPHIDRDQPLPAVAE